MVYNMADMQSLTKSLAVLIAYYDEKEMLTECLESLLQSNVLPDEIIVHDDNSPNAADLFVPEKLKSKIIIIRSKENVGQGLARNKMISVAHSEYIHCHDADDKFHPDWCKEVKQALNDRGNIDMVLTRVIGFDANHILERLYLSKHIDAIHADHDLIGHCILGGFVPSCATYKKSIAMEVKGFQSRFEFPVSEDYDFHLRLATKVQSHTVIAKDLVLQRWAPNSSCRDGENKYRLSIFEYQIKSLAQNISAVSTDYNRLFCERYFRLNDMLHRRDSHLATIALLNACKLFSPEYKSLKGPLFAMCHKYFGASSTCRLLQWYAKYFPRFLRANVSKIIRKNFSISWFADTKTTGMSDAQ